jgi:hypothetical protein
MHAAMADDEQQQAAAYACVPPGFRFHPTEEELVGYYLARKVASQKIDDLDIIREVDLYRIEPWDLQGMYGWMHVPIISIPYHAWP